MLIECFEEYFSLLQLEKSEFEKRSVKVFLFMFGRPVEPLA